YGLGAAGYQAQLESKASSIAIATRDKTGSLDAKEMVAVSQQIAAKQGTKPGEVLDSIMAAAEHGQGRVGAEMFLKKLPTYAALGLATDTNLADLAENSAAMTSMGIRDPDAQQRIMLKVAGASKEGNIGLREMGQNLSAAAGATEGYAGTAEERFVQASALITATRNFFNDVANKSADLKALGVVTTDKKTGLRRNAFDQYVDAVEKAKGDPEKLKGILGMQSRSIGQGIEAAYRRGGRPEVEKELRRYTDASMTPEEVQSDAALKMKDSSVRFNAELEKMRAAVGSKLLPLLADHLPKMSEAVQKVVEAVGDPDNIKQFTGYLSTGAKALELFVKHPVLTGAAFVGIKTAMGGIEALASTWIGKNLFAPVTNVSAGVVNVSGGLPGVGGGGVPGVGTKGSALGTLARTVALPIAAAAAATAGVIALDEYANEHSPGYAKARKENFLLFKHLEYTDAQRGFDPRQVHGFEAGTRKLLSTGDSSADRVRALLAMDASTNAPGTGLTMPALNAPMAAPEDAGPRPPVDIAAGAQIKIANVDDFTDSLARSLKRVGGRDPASGTPIMGQ
ncbi:MAG: hypothetical protein MUF34_19630, partial [Polyangiaceae bacterium]|nr:hypothetical protein [Polyangiaceae bacterium]